MGYRISQSEEMPTNVEMERFARRTIRLGFVGGKEKTVTYDSRIDPTSGGTQYRQYVGAYNDSPQDQRLSDSARERNVFTVENTEHIAYREYVGVEEMYLVTTDDGRSVRIMDSEELSDMLDAAAAWSNAEPVQQTRSEPEPVASTESEPEPEPEGPTYDRDIPVDNTADNKSEEEKEEDTRFDTDVPEPVSPDQ